MIGLDTNVLVRLFVDDDLVQARQARRFVADRCSRADPGFVDRVALCETVWVLTNVYGYGRPEVGEVIARLLRANDIVVEDSDCVAEALHAFPTGRIEFTDLLVAIVNRTRGCGGAWRGETFALLSQIKDRYAPSMQARIDMNDL